MLTFQQQPESITLAEAGCSQSQCLPTFIPDAHQHQAACTYSCNIIATYLGARISPRLLNDTGTRGQHRGKDVQTSTSRRAQGRARRHQAAAGRGAYLNLHGDKHRAQLFVQLFQHCEFLQAQTAEPVRQREWDAFRHHHPWGCATWYPVLGRQHRLGQGTLAFTSH